MTSRVDRFATAIEEEPTPPPDLDMLLAPLRDFAEALQRRGGVGAEVKASADQRRWHLILWPLHRPAFKSIVLTIHVYGARLLVPGELPGETTAFETAEAFTEWLVGFAAKPPFQAGISALRTQATETVDGRLERQNGMAILVGVPAETQKELDSLAVDAHLEVEAELAPREPIPADPTALVCLRSAGLVFDVREVKVDGRRVRFEVVKRAEV